MFPRLRHRFGSALLPRLDVLVELSTLGAYGVGEDGRPLLLEAGGASAPREDGAGRGVARREDARCVTAGPMLASLGAPPGRGRRDSRRLGEPAPGRLRREPCR